ncbi:Uncharacterised protein [Mycobacteroides abscessus subsp. abscessus]|nr:Uncharacterised protein [Mycobacteroides abscessus subsp. abscessus]
MQLLSLSKPRPAGVVAVERGLLVRVLAVAQHITATPGRTQPCRHAGGRCLVVAGHQHRSHPGCDGHVVLSGVPECQRRQLLPLVEREATVPDGGQHAVVPQRVHDDGDARVVLRRGADHRRATDVDLLDALVLGRARRHGLRERIQVHHDEFERLDTELIERGEVLGLAGVGQQAGVHTRVQSLDPAVQHLRETRDLFDGSHRNSLGSNGFRRRTGRHQGHAGLVQPAGQLSQAGLVVHADQRAPNRSSRHPIAPHLRGTRWPPFAHSTSHRGGPPRRSHLPTAAVRRP